MKDRKIVILENRDRDEREKLSLTDDQIQLLEWLLKDYRWTDPDYVKFDIIDDENPPTVI